MRTESASTTGRLEEEALYARGSARRGQSDGENSFEF